MESGDTRLATMKSGIENADYKPQPWLENDGVYFDEDGNFNPNAYDPDAPYEPQGNTYQLESNPEKIHEDPFDLDNLRFIDKIRVQNLLLKLEGHAAEIADAGSDRQIIAMIGTGGTIAMTMIDGELKPTLEPKALLDYAGGNLSRKFDVSSTEYPTPIDSSEQEVDYEADMVIAMSWIWKEMTAQCKKVFSGFAVSHGTDTLGAGATAVTNMLGPNCPFTVGFVGAQKTTEDDFDDVGVNVKNTLETMGKLKAKDKVSRFVYMGGTEGGAFHPAGVQKKDDRKVDAFGSPLHAKVMNASNFALGGIVDRFGRRYAETLDREGANADFQPIILRGYSPIIDITPKLGSSPAACYEEIMRNDTAKAVLLTTFGSYTANTKMRKAIQLAAAEKGMIVLGANPFPGGSSDHKYGPAKAMRDSGAHPVSTLPDATSMKVFVGGDVFGQNREALARFLTENNLIGEQNPESWMVEAVGDQTRDKKDVSKSQMPRFGAPDAMFKKVA